MYVHVHVIHTYMYVYSTKMMKINETQLRINAISMNDFKINGSSTFTYTIVRHIG